MMEGALLMNILFWLGAFIFIALGTLFCLAARKGIEAVFLLLFLSLPFPNLSITFLAQDYYHIATRGIEIHLADLCLVILFFAILGRGKRYKIRWLPPLTGAFALYLSAAIISWIAAEPSVFNTNLEAMLKSQNPKLMFPSFATKLYPLFEIIKIIRSYLIFWIALNVFVEKKQVLKLLKLTPALILFFTAFGLFERYVLDIYRVSAYMGHTNVYNTYIGMLGAWLLPFGFSEKRTTTSLWYWTGIIAAVLAIILTVSRSALVAYVLAGGVAALIGLRRHFTPRNLVFMGMAALAMFLFLAKSWDTLTTRFFEVEKTLTAKSGRSLLNDEAVLMVQDFPLGVGPGNFSAYSIAGYAERADAEVGAMAHNIWFLTLAEMGYFGLAALLFLWVRYLMIWGKTYMKARKTGDRFSAALLLGIFLALVVFHFQSFFHFTYRVTPILFFAQILMGFSVKLAILGRKTSRSKAQFIRGKAPAEL